jgi:hypothetical protein
MGPKKEPPKKSTKVVEDKVMTDVPSHYRADRFADD